MNKYNVDLNAVLLKPLYLGLLMNIFAPSLIVIIAYFIESRGGVKVVESGNAGDMILWILGVVALADGAVAIYLKQKQFYAPMIRSRETFVADFTSGVFSRSILIYAIAVAISFYGLVVYFLSGKFDYLLFFVILSFIAFQIIRPRPGFLQKVLDAQEKHVEEGHFLAGR